LLPYAVELIFRLIGESSFEHVIVSRPPEFTAANANVRYKLPTAALSYNRTVAKARSNTKLLIRKPWRGRC
jgi:hypothetical protein